MKKNILIILLIIGLIISLFFNFKPVPQEVITVSDTIKIESVQIKEKTKLINTTNYDTVFIFKRDTITDTIKIEIPIEHKQYKDTIRTDTSEVTLDIKYSGFKPSLDEINITNHYWQNESVKKAKIHLEPSVSFGIYSGYGVSFYNGTVIPNPQIGIGCSVGFSVVRY